MAGQQPMHWRLAILLVGGWWCPAATAEEPQGQAHRAFSQIHASASQDPLPAKPQRLPPAGSAKVSFAGGAAKFVLPEGWRASELPHGRELRLVLAPGPAPQSFEHFQFGIWMSFGSSGGDDRRSLQEELTGRFPRRVLSLTGQPVELESAQQRTVSGYPALQQEYRLLPADNAQTSSRGVHLRVQTQAGALDVHLLAPADRYAAGRAVFDRLVDGLEVQEPRMPETAMASELADAAPIVGSWKSLRALLELRADGRVVLQLDSKKHFRLDERGHYDYQEKTKRLGGRFAAAGDIIRITWDDGSRLNIRWRLTGGRLLLTDHHGRVSDLQRIYR